MNYPRRSRSNGPVDHYSDEDAIGVAERVTNEALEDVDVEWSVVTDVTDEPETNRIIDLAEKHGCDHLFTLGQPRSPTGTAVFGDTTQKLRMSFPGYVTVSMNCPYCLAPLAVVAPFAPWGGQ